MLLFLFGNHFNLLKNIQIRIKTTHTHFNQIHLLFNILPHLLYHCHPLFLLKSRVASSPPFVYSSIYLCIMVWTHRFPSCSGLWFITLLTYLSTSLLPTSQFWYHFFKEPQFLLVRNGNRDQEIWVFIC